VFARRRSAIVRTRALAVAVPPAAILRRRRRCLAGRHEVGRQLAADVRTPDLPGVVARRPERGIDRLEEAPHVLEIAVEERLGLAVVRRADDLREVDDDRTVRPQEHVVRREISVDEVASEHPDHLPT
jgi:hypothetical protein